MPMISTPSLCMNNEQYDASHILLRTIAVSLGRVRMKTPSLKPFGLAMEPTTWGKGIGSGGSKSKQNARPTPLKKHKTLVVSLPVGIFRSSGR